MNVQRLRGRILAAVLVALVAAGAGEREVAAGALARLGDPERLPSNSSRLLVLHAMIHAGLLVGDKPLVARAAAERAPFAGLPVMASLAVTCSGRSRRRSVRWPRRWVKSTGRSRVSARRWPATWLWGTSRLRRRPGSRSRLPLSSAGQQRTSVRPVGIASRPGWVAGSWSAACARSRAGAAGVPEAPGAARRGARRFPAGGPRRAGAGVAARRAGRGDRARRPLPGVRRGGGAGPHVGDQGDPPGAGPDRGPARGPGPAAAGTDPDGDVVLLRTRSRVGFGESAQRE